MIGNLEYRLRVGGALGHSSATLALSHTAPVNEIITPESFAGTVIAQGSGSGLGLATLHLPLYAGGSFSPGEVIFAQWIVTDPGAAGGQAFSVVARIPF